ISRSPYSKPRGRARRPRLIFAGRHSSMRSRATPALKRRPKMSDFDHDAFVARMNEIHAEGSERYGKKNFESATRAIATITGGLTPEQMAAAASMPDAAERFMHGGMDSLCRLAANGDEAANRAYTEIRNEQRKAYRASRAGGR